MAMKFAVADGLKMSDETEWLRGCESRLTVEFGDRSRLAQALTHRSWFTDRESQEHYERLEFMGDAVLQLCVTEHLFGENPGLDEGRLAQMRSQIVSATTLGEVGRELGLGELVRLGPGEERNGGRTRVSMLADLYESVLGALYLDQGLDAARRFVSRTVLKSARRLVLADRLSQNPKGELQQITQATDGSLPEYRLLTSSGPDHRPEFAVEVWISGRLMGSGRANRKQTAEKKAALAALQTLTLQAGGNSGEASVLSSGSTSGPESRS